MDRITHAVRHKQWLEQLKECNASGLTRKEWCQKNGVSLILPVAVAIFPPNS